MHLTNSIAVFALTSIVTAVAIPSSPNNPLTNVLSLRDAHASEEDGLFQVTTTADGNHTVLFTPWDELVKQSGHSDVIARDTTSHNLPRAGLYSSCDSDSTLERPDIDSANGYILDAYCPGNAVATKNSGDWGWVFRGSTAVYLCPYATSSWIRGNMIDALQWIDNNCGFLHTGWQQLPGTNRVEIGRTTRGNNFCASGFVGY